MIFTETKLKGAFIIDVERREDERGYFGRTWCVREFEEHGLNAHTVQSSVSFSKTKGTQRGFHFQAPPYAEAKTVSCTTGGFYDVIIDLRPDSPTYKQWIGVEIIAEELRTLYVPEGFAHGFYTIRDNTTARYLTSQYYTPGAEIGIKYNDPAFNIQWPGEPTVISEKDNGFPLFKEEMLYRKA